jgi:hypothetical protein
LRGSYCQLPPTPTAFWLCWKLCHIAVVQARIAENGFYCCVTRGITWLLLLCCVTVHSLYSNPLCMDTKVPLPQYCCAAHTPERAHRGTAQQCLEQIHHNINTSCRINRDFPLNKILCITLSRYIDIPFYLTSDHHVVFATNDTVMLCFASGSVRLFAKIFHSSCELRVCESLPWRLNTFCILGKVTGMHNIYVKTINWLMFHPFLHADYFIFCRKMFWNCRVIIASLWSCSVYHPPVIQFSSLHDSI